nr:hypothetical protein [Tanacetum cinerariifolium]
MPPPNSKRLTASTPASWLASASPTRCTDWFSSTKMERSCAPPSSAEVGAGKRGRDLRANPQDSAARRLHRLQADGPAANHCAGLVGRRVLELQAAGYRPGAAGLLRPQPRPAAGSGGNLFGAGPAERRCR